MTDPRPEVASPHVERSVAPTTTSEQDLVTAGQRRVNIIWEVTQAVIAVMVTGAVLAIAGMMILNTRQDDDAQAFLLLSNAFFMIVTFYYQRTNHTKTGGVGFNPSRER